MKKNTSRPIIIDNCIQLNIKDLKNLGYLIGSGSKKFDLKWTIGTQVSEISVCLINNRDKGIMEFSYIINEEPVKYRIRLICKPTNLGKGVIWYFICPATHRLCRKLYLGYKYFVHREAIENSYYSKQIKSKKYREIVATFGKDFKIDELYEELFSKNFKRYYAGKPTKRFLTIIQKLRRLEGKKFNLSNCL